MSASSFPIWACSGEMYSLFLVLVSKRLILSSNSSSPMLMLARISYVCHEQWYRLVKHILEICLFTRKMFSGHKLVWIMFFWWSTSNRLMIWIAISIVSNSVKRVFLLLAYHGPDGDPLPMVSGESSLVLIFDPSITTFMSNSWLSRWFSMKSER